MGDLLPMALSRMHVRQRQLSLEKLILVFTLKREFYISVWGRDTEFYRFYWILLDFIYSNLWKFTFIYLIKLQEI
jgi:hypothetical protein